MPKLYKTKYCMYCGKIQRLCTVKMLCDECRYLKDTFDYSPPGYFFNYHTGKIEDFVVRFN